MARSFYELIDPMISCPAGGWEVIVNAIYVRKTYISWLEGSYTERMNAHIVSDVKPITTSLWGVRKTHVIPPKMRTEVNGQELLPEIMYFAWISCETPINPGFDGSELVVVWFGHKEPNKSLPETVADALRHLPWPELADNYEV